MTRQLELAGFSVALSPLPDETLFSWCSRYHRIAVNGHDRTTCMQLFGHYRAGMAHDFPARIGSLASRAVGALGSEIDIIRQRTLLPFYLPFRSLALGKQAEQALCGQGIGHLKYRLGLLTSGLGAAHPLKACPLCIDDDLSQHGWAYWRRNQQLPGVWLCAQHHLPLQVSHLKVDQVARFSWVLPNRASCMLVAGLGDSLKGASRQAAWLLKLGALCGALLDCTSGCFADPVRISLTFRSRLNALDMADSSGRIRWTVVEPVLEQMSLDMASLPELSHQSAAALLRNQLARLLSGRALTHPLRYLAWIATWFADLDDFRREYTSTVAPLRLAPVNVVVAHHGPNEQQQQALVEVCRGHISLTKAARQAGVSYSTMAAWASRLAVEGLRRPKKLNPSLWEKMVALLGKGEDKEAVALAFDVSVVTVTRVLRSVPGLQDQWHSVRRERRCIAARRAWSEVAGLYGYMGINALRRLQPAAYAWLYRNDRAWLKVCASAHPRRLAGNHADKRIENADARMAIALRKLINTSRGMQFWTLDVLKRSAPWIGKAIRYPERWPDTVKTLAFILTASPS